MTNHVDHFAACAGCAHFDPVEKCMNGITWIGEEPIPANPHCNTPILYRHPDGAGVIAFDHERNVLEVSDERTGRAVCVPIGTLGILALGSAMVSLGIEILEAE